MNRADVSTVARRAAAALLLSTAPFVAVDRAQATCSSTTPNVFDCTGTTTDQNPPNGFGTGTETGITINVQSGATVTSTAPTAANPSGIFVEDGTINNLGIISSAKDGVRFGGNSSIVTNSGTILGTANVGVGGLSTPNLTVTNNPGATVTGGLIGIGATVANITNDGGSITATLAGGRGIFADGATVTNKVNGSSIGSITGGAFAIDAANVTVANGDASTAGGVITGGTAIHATGTATVNNFGDGTTTGIIAGATFGIDAGTVNVTGNSGRISAVGNGGTAIHAASSATVANKVNGTSIGQIFGQAFAINADGGNGNPSANVTVANGDALTPGGTISSNGTAIHATGTATVSNFGDGNTTGIISGVILGINAGTVTVTSNTGRIEATTNQVIATAINATAGVANVTNDGGTIFSNFGTAINATGDAIVTNNVNGATVGQIFGQGLGISAANVTVANRAKIATGSGGIAIEAAGTGTATVSNFGDGNTTGIISGGALGISAGTVIVNANTGKIEATAANGVAINASNDATVTNDSGVINANASNGPQHAIAINAGGTATVANGTGTIQGDIFAIQAQTVMVTRNNGRIVASNVLGTAASAAINAIGDANIVNAGAIQAVRGSAAVAIKAGGTSATVANLAPGVITGNAFAITAPTVTVTANSGLIEATADAGANGVAASAIAGNSVTVSNSGTIRENGVGARAINANSGAGAATITNLATGSIIADGNNGVAIDAGSATITNAGTISAAHGVAINAASVGASAIVRNLFGGRITGGGIGIQAVNLDVANASGATISGGTQEGILGSGNVTTGGTISGGTNSVKFVGGAGTTNTLTLQTGAVLNGDAAGSTAGATNNLILQGSGATTSNFVSFNNLNVQASGTWIWNSTTSAFGQTTVESGTLAVDGVLFSPVSVSSGAVLGGHGAINGVVSVAGTLAPGAAVPFSTLTVNGNVNFANASIYRVNVGAANQTDKLQLNASGTASLGNATVNVLAQSGFALATPYNILNASGGLNNTRFGSVTSNLAFLTPTLTYDLNNVFLTLDAINNGGGGGGNGFGLVGAAQTRNQRAVAGALDASPSTNPLVLAVLGQTFDGARRAFDALSGEIFGSVHNLQAGETQFARSAMLGRMRQASYAGYAGELGALAFGGPELAYAGDSANAAYAADVLGSAVPGKAPARPSERSRDLTFWTQGVGGWGHADSDGNAASLRSRFAGFLSGVDARFGEIMRAGFTAGYLRSDLNADARASSAGIDSVQIGAYAGGKLGALNVRGGASYSFDSIDASRGIFFPGFTDQAKTSFHGHVGQVFGEVGYGMTLNRLAIEPLAGLAYVHVHDNSFLESGGAAVLSGSGASENLGYSTLGIRAATALPLANGTVLVPRASVQWQYAFGDVTPTAGLALQGTGAGFTVAGIPIARNTALVEGGVDWRFSPQAKLGASYQGELAAHAESHAFKGAFSWNF